MGKKDLKTLRISEKIDSKIDELEQGNAQPNRESIDDEEEEQEEDRRIVKTKAEDE